MTISCLPGFLLSVLGRDLVIGSQALPPLRQTFGLTLYGNIRRELRVEGDRIPS
jgi:hypothetical protein